MNYWRLAGDEEFRRVARRQGHVADDFLEVGVMLDDPRQVERVCVYLPADIDRRAVEDCAPYLRRPEIAQGIFNDRLTTIASARPGPRCFELHSDTGVFCRVFPFLDGGDVIDACEFGVQPEADGTLLTITRAAIDEACYPASPVPVRVYFRLRIRLGAGTTAFVHTIDTPDRLLLSGFDEIEYVDFRLNEARTLPAQIESRMRNEDAGVGIRLRMVAFLTAVPVLSELSVSNTAVHKLRLLEHALWNTYVPSGIPPGMMVYHWKRAEAGGVPDFAAFVKLQTRRSGRSTLIRYLAVAFGFGILGNLAASGVQWIATKMWVACHTQAVPSTNRPTGGAGSTLTSQPQPSGRAGPTLTPRSQPSPQARPEAGARTDSLPRVPQP